VARAHAASAAREAPARAVINAPLFRGLVEGFENHPEDRHVVLDLGPARPETVALFGRFRCRLEIADIAEDLDEINGLEEPDELNECLHTVLPPQHAETADLVLCWDLLNYLERPALKALMYALQERLAPGARLHALIVYADARMPARPARIVPGDGGLEHDVSGDPAARPAPRYSPDELARLASGYTVEHARLLRNGMQEFLFNRRSG
jgi:hypothetical protein